MATEKQVDYIKILTNERREEICTEWAQGMWRGPQRAGLGASIGSDALWDLDQNGLDAKWQETVDGVLAYLDEVDANAPEMSKTQASEMINTLKGKNVVYLYWQWVLEKTL